MERIPQSATIRIPLQAYLASDHISPATGKTIAVTISKNGAAYGNPSGGATNAVEIGSGSYYVDLSTTDTGTIGPLFILGTAATVDPINAIYNVVNANNGGLAALPDTACTTNASLLTSGTGTAQISAASGVVSADTTKLAGQTVTAAAGVTFPTSVASPTNITAGTITTATNLTNAPTAGDFTTAMKASLNAATPASVTGAVGSVTGNIGGNVAGSVASVTNAVTVNGTSPLTESYAAQGAPLTLATALYDIHQFLTEFSIVSATVTVNGRDGTTAKKTFTLDSPTAPTSISETS